MQKGDSQCQAVSRSAQCSNIIGVITSDNNIGIQRGQTYHMQDRSHLGSVTFKYNGYILMLIEIRIDSLYIVCMH